MKRSSLFATIFILITLFCLFGCSQNELCISFDSNGGSPIDNVIVMQNVVGNYLLQPTKANYVFEGWFFDNQYKKAFIDGSSFSESCTLYAKWSPKPVTLTVIDSDLDLSYQYDYHYGDTVNSIKLSKDGFELVNYTRGTQTATFPFTIYEDQTLVGHWQKLVYTLTFAKDVTGIDDMHVSYGDTITLPTAKPIVERKFAGWQSQGDDQHYYLGEHIVTKSHSFSPLYLAASPYKMTLENDCGLKNNFHVNEQTDWSKVYFTYYLNDGFETKKQRAALENGDYNVDVSVLNTSKVEIQEIVFKSLVYPQLSVDFSYEVFNYYDLYEIKNAKLFDDNLKFNSADDIQNLLCTSVNVLVYYDSKDDNVELVPCTSDMITLLEYGTQIGHNVAIYRVFDNFEHSFDLTMHYTIS